MMWLAFGCLSGVSDTQARATDSYNIRIVRGALAEENVTIVLAGRAQKFAGTLLTADREKTVSLGWNLKTSISAIITVTAVP